VICRRLRDVRPGCTSTYLSFLARLGRERHNHTHAERGKGAKYFPTPSADLAPFAFSSVICQRARNILQLARFISSRCRTRSFVVMRANRKFQMIRRAREPNSICVMDNAASAQRGVDGFVWRTAIAIKLTN
jgi:hypothetical protein